ncbi:hypothetical protein [Intestinirhabdus alba]|jgi:hypothetical protein|uniref:Pectate lyase superfamily protein domain-containing protein n=1 Tax=Intestinirhabdus alba TaxID=2899544 RepID=A0A6L6IUN9_9ENTR|nr:hypothetical protein [Intestinirhabdus alba]MTH48730.1 hypothetical protein [Intestinirhabdus alba]
MKFLKKSIENFGIFPDTGQDCTRKLNDCLEIISVPGNENIELTVPPGRYRFDGDIVIPSHTFLTADLSRCVRENKPVVFYSNNAKAVSIGEISQNISVDFVRIRFIVFDNIVVRFSGAKKKNIRIRSNAFIKSKTPTVSNPNEQRELNSQIEVWHSSYEITGNIFMRGREYPGKAINTYKCHETKIIGNFLGSLSNAEKASAYLSLETQKMLNLLKKNKESLGISDDEGYFVSAWYATDMLINSVFSMNFFCGNTLQYLYNPETQKDDIERDHIIYIKQYNNVDIYQNYFSGWPSDAHGQVKIRNAQNLIFSANYLDGTSFNGRAYDNSTSLFLKNTYVLNNFISEGVINYYEDVKDPNKSIKVIDFIVFGNVFSASDKEIPRISASSKPVRDIVSDNLFSVFSSNKYVDGKDVKQQKFNNIDQITLENKIPDEKKKYLNMKWIKPTNDDSSSLN